MRENKHRRIVWMLLGILMLTPSVYAQYTVTGGQKEPLLAVDNKVNRIKVYLVYGTENLNITFTSDNSSHQWYRYRTAAATRENIQSSRQGNTSTITNLEEGYGYGVIEGDHYATAEYIWVIDYSKYPVDIRNLHVSPNSDPCWRFQLDGSDLTPALTYRTPAGVETLIQREYEVRYNSLTWNASDKNYRDTVITENIYYPTRTALNHIPLQDTEIRLSGDLFSIHFGVEEEYIIDQYETSKVIANPEAIILSTGTGNIASTGAGADESPCERELFAPAEIRFAAHANTPVASVYRWKMTSPNQLDTMIFLFEEFEYTFNQAGEYTIMLEVGSNRPGACIDDEFTCKFSITETEMNVPNAFTPVGSPGTNDVFKVAYKSVISFKGWIFNRWGSELFYWNDPAQGWDGKYRGKYVPAGPYFYVIEYTGTDGKKRKKSGDVNVIHVKDNEIITE